MLKRVLKDREFNSCDEIERVITTVWDELIFDEMQSIFHDWISHLAWGIKNGESILLNKTEMISSYRENLKIGAGDRNLLYIL
jgi:hypothetical protein